MGPEAKGAVKGATPQEFREAVAGKWAQALPSTSKGAKRAPSVHRTSPRKTAPEEVSSGDMEPGSPTGLSAGVGAFDLTAKSASKRALAAEEDGSGTPKKSKQGQAGVPMETEQTEFYDAGLPDGAGGSNKGGAPAAQMNPAAEAFTPRQPN